MLLFVFVRSCIDLGRADAGSTTYFGIGSPLVIGLGFLVLGAVLMAIWRLAGHREFFARRREAAEPELVAGEARAGRRGAGPSREPRQLCRAWPSPSPRSRAPAPPTPPPTRRFAAA